MPGVPDYRDTPTPTPHRIPRSLENGKLDPGWINGSGSLPLTTRGDLLSRDATTNVRVPIGAAGTVLTSDGVDPSWQAPAPPTPLQQIFPPGTVAPDDPTKPALRYSDDLGGPLQIWSISLAQWL